MLDRLFSSLNGCIAYLDLNYRFIQVNHAYARLTGCTVDELIGRSIFDVFPQSRTRFEPIFREVVQTRSPHIGWRTSFELVAQDPSAETFWDFGVQVLSNIQGRPAGLLLIASDITQRYKAELELQESRALFEHLFESDPDANILVDENGKILSINRQAESDFGYEPGELVGQPVEILLPEHFAEIHVQYRREYMRNPQLRPMGVGKELLGRRKNGEEFPVDVKLSPLMIAQGFRILVVVRDITYRKQIEAELAEVQHHLIQGIEAERLRLAQDLHDGPMQDLYGVIYQIESIENEMGGRTVQTELSNTRKTLNQVIDVLREICAELRPTTLVHFGLETAILSHAERFQSLHPELVVHLDLMQDGKLLSEPVRLALFRIYQHLLSNVVRHARAQNVWIRLSLGPEEVVLDVADDGTGFNAPESMVKLAREGHLGLVGATERAEAIGGKVEIEASPGSGARIRTIIPYAKAAADGG
ncbi:MAG TPA: PAS domain S-box protein [Anaerolineaceae bacterium]|nr:PAS domain S-box protein [Anaerolineaceae bacterium]